MTYVTNVKIKGSKISQIIESNFLAEWPVIISLLKRFYNNIFHTYFGVILNFCLYKHFITVVANYMHK